MNVNKYDGKEIKHNIKEHTHQYIKTDSDIIIET